MVSSLLSQQASYKTILNTTKSIYEQQRDSVSLKDLAITENLDTVSIEYRTAVFKHATKNGFFTLKSPDSLARSIYASYDTDTVIKKYVKNDHAVETFWKNEKRKNIDIIPVLKKLKEKNIPIYALYGKQDGLYSKEQIEQLKKIVGTTRLKYLDNCSHTVFIDQQPKFIQSLKDWLN